MTEEKIHRNALKPGYQLHWYRIERVLGQGGFGITYLAQDFNLDRRVAVKEYLPVQIAVREGTVLHPVTADTGEQFRWGLDRFLAEAQTLARFEHPNIVRVRNVFEANNTAYMVMAYEEGESLHEIFNRRVTLAESELRAILLPLLDGLETIHAGGFIHRDIKPANIVIRKDGSPVLLDFGSARQSLGEQTHMLTRIFTPGYAPLEQYYTKGDQQGPWTDIYALAATLYRGLAGEAPTDAMQRSQGIIQSGRDPLVPARQMGLERYSERFLRAIDRALSFKPKQRPQTIAVWRPEFSAPPRPSSRTVPGAPVDDQTTLVDRTRDAISHTLASWRSRLRTGRLAGWWRAQTARRRSRPPPSHIPSVWLAGLIASATILLVSLILFVKPDESPAPPSPKPLASVLKPADTVKLEVVAPEAKAPPPERPSENQQAVDDARRDQEQAERRKQEQIAALLAGAHEDIKAGRLTLLKGNNALEKYRSVLALQADHPQATEGIRGLVEKLLQRAREAMDGANWSKAQAHLDQAAAILPDAEAVAAVRTDLNARKGEAPKQPRPEEGKVELSQAERNVNKLIEQARRSIERKRWDKAQAYIDQAAAIMPQGEDVVLIQGELIAHRAQAEPQPVPADRVEPAPAPSAGKVPIGPDRLVKIQKATSTLSKVKPGETIEFVTEYALTLPEGEKNTYVEVTWVLKKDGKKLGGEGVHAGLANPGTNAASNELTLPGYAKPGRYVVEHIVKAGNISDTGKSYFSVVPN